MTGTQNHEGLAGVAAAVDYLADVGARHAAAGGASPSMSGRRLQLHAGMAAIQAYEAGLSARLLEALAERPHVKVWGITDRARLAERVPTIALTIAGRSPREIAEHLASRSIFTWSGNLYALGLTERLGLEDRGGMLRVGLVHYNTAAEVDRLVQALDELAPR
jgi:selenocysteine lyase/cysteine desulfurase